MNASADEIQDYGKQSPLTLGGANTFSGGLTITNGTVRALAAGSAGSGLVTVASGTTLVIGGSHTSAINMTSATLAGAANTAGTGSALGGGQFTSGDLTVTGNNTVMLTDPATTTINSEMILTGNLQGSGNINVQAGTNNTNVDGGPGFRLRGTGTSNFSGAITLGNNVKGELQTTVAGPFTPLGTGKIVMTGGDAARGGGTNVGSTTGGYSEVNLRNNSAGNTTVGNNVEVTGSGLVILGEIGTAPANAVTTMGSLKIGGNQELGTYNSSGNAHTVAFGSVTLTGSATFSPRATGFGTSTTAANLQLGNITEQSSGSSVTMSGASTLSLTGSNTFTGGLIINSGVVQLGNVGALNSATPNTVTLSTVDPTIPATLQLNGNSVTANGIVANGGVASFIENANATPATLTVSSGVANTFGGVLRDGTGGGALSLVASGAGTLVLNNNSTYTGTTTINSGTTLQLGDGNSAGSLANTSSISGSGTLAFNRSTDLTVSQSISGSLVLKKDGPNALTLSGPNTYSGPTNVNGKN